MPCDSHFPLAATMPAAQGWARPHSRRLTKMLCRGLCRAWAMTHIPASILSRRKLRTPKNSGRFLKRKAKGST